MREISVNIKSAATKRNKIKTVTVPYDEGITDVKGLIEATVAWFVKDYNQRRENSELLIALTSEQIEDKAAQGKISFGVNYGNKDADVSKATADALEAFSDGIVVIFADDRRLQRLDESIEMYDFATYMRQTTRGRGYFTFEFVRYEEAPFSVLQELQKDKAE